MSEKIVRIILWLLMPINAYFAFKGSILSAIIIPFVIGYLWYGYYMDRKTRVLETEYDETVEKLFELRRENRK